MFFGFHSFISCYFPVSRHLSSCLFLLFDCLFSFLSHTHTHTHTQTSARAHAQTSLSLSRSTSLSLYVSLALRLSLILITFPFICCLSKHYYICFDVKLSAVSKSRRQEWNINFRYTWLPIRNIYSHHSSPRSLKKIRKRKFSRILRWALRSFWNVHTLKGEKSFFLNPSVLQVKSLYCLLIVLSISQSIWCPL